MVPERGWVRKVAGNMAVVSLILHFERFYQGPAPKLSKPIGYICNCRFFASRWVEDNVVRGVPYVICPKEITQG